MTVDLVSLLSACAAVLAAIVLPLVTWRVGKGQINASIVGANRQRRIDMLRDLVAEFTSQLAAALILRERYAEQSLRRFPGDPLLLERMERMVLVKSKVRLLINPLQEDQNELYAMVEQAYLDLRSSERHELVVENIERISDAIARKSQIVLKREWLRVKNGR